MRPFIYLYRILPLFKDSEQGAQTVIYCAVDKSLENESGKYYRYFVNEICVFKYCFLKEQIDR